jgi:type II secretory pathway pseudopilin PulG
MKLFKKKWFTLIEMLLVILIIALLLAKLLSLSWTSIKELSFNNDNAIFLSQYNKLLSQSNSANYINWKSFNKSILNMKSQHDKFNISYKSSSEEIKLNIPTLERTFLSWFVLNETITFAEIDLYFLSHQIWCQLSWDGNIYSTWNLLFEIVSDNLYTIESKPKTKKYEINLDSCKIKYVKE